MGEENKNMAKKEEITFNEVPLYINPLKPERISVRFIPRESGMVTNPKHVLYGGMSDNAIRIFTVPTLSSGTFVNILTNEEKAFLEKEMGLQDNALSIYLKEDNYWANYNVRLTKGDNYLLLDIPEDYIKYKVLLANRDYICKSLQELANNPKATYLFVIVSDNEEIKFTKTKLNATQEAFKIYGKIEENKEVLKYIVEIIDGRPISDNSKLEFVQAEAYKIIQSNPKLFISVANDNLIDTKILIKKAVKAGLINRRGDYYYLTENNQALCEGSKEPTLESASIYINSPKYQELKLMLQAKLKE